MVEQFTKDEVTKIANLAYLNLTDAEISKMTDNLNVINDAIKKVSEVANDNIEPSSHPIEIVNVFRDDVPATYDNDLLTVQQAISGAPKSIDNQFVAPQILGEE